MPCSSVMNWRWASAGQRSVGGSGGLPKDKEEWLERYETSVEMLAGLRQEGIAAGIYTQTTDVEGEINGLITYDRKVHKIPAPRLKQIGKVLFP